MQDYPQHLFLAQVTATFDRPDYNWKDFYRVDLGVRPYMLWYLAMRMLSGLNLEVAGKILFSLYILLVTALVLVARRLAPTQCVPWGALLLYPFAFNQMYYLGFSNYIISLPLLFLALLDLPGLNENLTSLKIARHSFYLALLFLTHPYSALVYIVLAITSVLFSQDEPTPKIRLLIPAAVMTVVIATWYLVDHTISSAPLAQPWMLTWRSVPATLLYYVLMFSGMRVVNGPDVIAVLSWCVIGFVFFSAWRRNGQKHPARRRLASLYLASLAGFCVLPFWMGYYSYFNFRLAPVSYFALSLLLCTLRLSFRPALVVGISAVVLVAGAGRTQSAISREVETVLPVIAAAERNSLILPLAFDSHSDVLDPLFFYQMHSHEGDYYHLLVGGGANPSLFPNAMMPVQYRPGLHLPYPLSLQGSAWVRCLPYYDYVLVREAPAEAKPYLVVNGDLVAAHGPWSLFKKKSPRKDL